MRITRSKIVAAAFGFGASLSLAPDEFQSCLLFVAMTYARMAKARCCFGAPACIQCICLIQLEQWWKIWLLTWTPIQLVGQRSGWSLVTRAWPDWKILKVRKWQLFRALQWLQLMFQRARLLSCQVGLPGTLRKASRRRRTSTNGLRCSQPFGTNATRARCSQGKGCSCPRKRLWIGRSCAFEPLYSSNSPSRPTRQTGERRWRGSWQRWFPRETCRKFKIFAFLWCFWLACCVGSPVSSLPSGSEICRAMWVWFLFDPTPVLGNGSFRGANICMFVTNPGFPDGCLMRGWWGCCGFFQHQAASVQGSRPMSDARARVQNFVRDVLKCTPPVLPSPCEIAVMESWRSSSDTVLARSYEATPNCSLYKKWSPKCCLKCDFGLNML